MAILMDCRPVFERNINDTGGVAKEPDQRWPIDAVALCVHHDPTARRVAAARGYGSCDDAASQLSFSATVQKCSVCRVAAAARQAVGVTHLNRIGLTRYLLVPCCEKRTWRRIRIGRS